MSRDTSNSLGDDPTYVGNGKEREGQSLGDQSTYAGSNESSLSDLGDIGDDLGHSLAGLEIVDLESRYTIIRPIGKGGMGEVFLATDTRLNRKVAIKRILGRASRSKAAVSRFLIEARSIAALNHPNIVQIYDYGRANDGPFLIMEYVDGISLLEKCREGAIPLEEAIDLACQLCDGLGKAHAANIIHRDIKPANILLTQEGIPKLTDFGLAKAEAKNTGVTMAGAVLGTLDFMAPEQRKDASLADARSDLWSLAATLYQMVTGESPRVINLEDVPGEIRSVISVALKSKKEARYQNVVEFRDSMRGIMTIGQASEETSIELETGECSNCHSKNEISRKFCMKCGYSLRTNCLSCDKEISVWESFCGECGGNQVSLCEQRKNELDVLLTKSKQYCVEYEFDKAICIAKEILDIEDDRFASSLNQARLLVEQIEDERCSSQQEAELKFKDAEKHRKALDYKSAIAEIDAIPPNLRNAKMDAYYQKLKSDQRELRELYRKIKEQVDAKDWSSLISLVNRAVELGGEREDVCRLRKRLQDRLLKHKKVYSDAVKAWDHGEGSARNALAILGKLANSVDADFAKLIASFTLGLRAVVSAEAGIARIVGGLKESWIEEKELAKLYSKVIVFLVFSPEHQQMNKLRNKLNGREGFEGNINAEDFDQFSDLVSWYLMSA